jgi:O-antigen/teichoic acid export membrane protein
VEPVRQRAAAGNALVRNAFALMFSTVGSAALGMAFWIVAAHLYDAKEVGHASAEVAAVSLVAGLAQIGLGAIFARFLPLARRQAGRMVTRGYGASLLVAVVLAAGFAVLGFGHDFLGHDLTALGVFGAGVIMYAVFALQDCVLTALRKATWVPTENIAVAVARLILLPVLLVYGVRFGAFLAWAIPMVLAVVLVNLLVYGQLLPERRRAPGAEDLPTSKEIVSYAAAQYVSGIVGSVVTLVPPVMVAAHEGAQEAAYFYFPWLFATSCMALLWNIVFSLVVEAAHNLAKAKMLLARAVKLGLLVTVGGGLVLGLGAPWILAVIGSKYASGGTTALQLIALSLPFVGVNTLYGAVSLIQRRTWQVTVLQAVSATLFLGLAFPAMDRFGAAGVALSFLVSRVFAALAAVPALVRRYRELAANAETVIFMLDRDALVMAAETEVLFLPPLLARGVAPAPEVFMGGSGLYVSSEYFGQHIAAARYAGLDEQPTQTIERVA